MSAHSKVVIDKFCELCFWLHQSCQTRKSLFDENPDWDNLKQPHYEHFFWRLSVILQEYWLHQLAKLHDPAVQGGNINLSIDYMIDYGQWDPKTDSQLKKREISCYRIMISRLFCSPRSLANLNREKRRNILSSYVSSLHSFEENSSSMTITSETILKSSWPASIEAGLLDRKGACSTSKRTEMFTPN